MKFTITQSDDLETARALHKRMFPSDKWPGDLYHYWIAYEEGGEPVGFCAAGWLKGRRLVFLARAAVLKAYSNHGLQRRMIYVRIKWARSVKAEGIFTYTTATNFKSIANLIRCGFYIFRPNNLHRSWGRSMLFFMPLIAQVRKPHRFRRMCRHAIQAFD